jgi:hypothetical protein
VDEPRLTALLLGDVASLESRFEEAQIAVVSK